MNAQQNVPIRGQMRVRGYRRVSHGLFLHDVPGLTVDEEWRRDLRAWLEVLPEDAVFTSVTAARLLKWFLPNLPEQTPVFAATGGGARPRRDSLVCSRLRRDSRGGRVSGLPIDSPEEILLRCSRDLDAVDLRIVVEGARRAGHVDEDRMASLLASRRPGVRLLREVWRRSTGKCDSGGEAVLQEFHHVLEIAFEAQKRLFNEAGQLVAVADLLIRGTRRLHEFDGAVHRDKLAHRADLRRDRGLHSAAYVRRGFTLDDLLNHALVTMHEIDRDLGRPHRMRRYRAWQALVEQSLYSPVGRERVMNRWHRDMGVTEWSRTAS